MSDLAIDVLLRPDEDGRRAAASLNARLRTEAAHGFAFDATHEPHITVLQRCVAAADLDRVLAVAARAAETADLGATSLHATGLVWAPFDTPPPAVLVSIDLAPEPALQRLHRTVLAALDPLPAVRPEPAAFFSLPGETGVGPDAIDYVARFVPEHAGEHYEPHLSIGVADEPVAARLQASFTPFRFGIEALAVYRIGEFGTARRRLASRPLGARRLGAA